MARPRRTTVTLIALVAAAGAMVGLSFVAVPLYRLFCQVTGYGGTPQVAAEAPDVVLDRVVTVAFDANVAPDLPWSFRPLQHALALHPGESVTVAYEATNLSDRAYLGMATFNVTPDKSGIYFSKIECFCFNEQYLGAGESARLEVTFFLDPALAEDRHLYDLGRVTLSYTFFDQGEAALAAYRERLEAQHADADPAPVEIPAVVRGHDDIVHDHDAHDHDAHDHDAHDHGAAAAGGATQ